MTHTHSWAVAAIDGPAHHWGTADSNAEAWMLALAAGRAALLAGDLDTLAVTVDDEMPTALYAPARDECGSLDPADVTADLVETYQDMTAGEVADRLVAGA
jgi:hypothetical protein